jgi:hypothetical protein
MVKSMAASIQFLAKSAPPSEVSVSDIAVIRMDSSMGVLSVDTNSNLELSIFSPLHYGQFLRTSIPFHLPTKCEAITTTGHGRGIVCMESGSLGFVKPVNESDHHLASSLVGLMIALLPTIGGVNPRLSHLPVKRNVMPGAIQAIEGINLLENFLFLATPLQAEIASRMKQPIDVLMRAVSRWVARQ